jgi:hypothetical protein
VAGERVWRWVATPLFRSYLASFLTLWVIGKVTLAVGAARAGLPPLRFAPGGEMWACVLELMVLAHFVRRWGEDVLLGNLGLDLGDALLPFVLVRFTLSGVLGAWAGRAVRPPASPPTPWTCAAEAGRSCARRTWTPCPAQSPRWSA